MAQLTPFLCCIHVFFLSFIFLVFRYIFTRALLHLNLHVCLLW